MVTNITNLTSADSFFSIIEFLNQQSNGIFSTMIIISFSFILAIILLKKAEALVAIWVSAIASTVLCFFFMMVSLVNWYIFLIYFLITVVITFLKYTELG